MAKAGTGLTVRDMGIGLYGVLPAVVQNADATEAAIGRGARGLPIPSDYRAWRDDIRAAWSVVVRPDGTTGIVAGVL